MRVCVILYLFAVLTYVLGEGGLLRPCRMSDIQCIRNTTQQFLENTAMGIPAFNIKPIDPISVPQANYERVPGQAMNCQINDTNIRGLRNLNITDFKMDLTAKHVQLTMRMNLDVEGRIKIYYENGDKSHSGSYRATVKLVTVSSYDYEMVTREGVEHYEVLPETLEFDYEDVSFLLSDDLNEALIRDDKSDYTTPKHSKKYESIVKELLVAPAHTIINNLREAARRLPKSAFFTDI